MSDLDREKVLINFLTSDLNFSQRLKLYQKLEKFREITRKSLNQERPNPYGNDVLNLYDKIESVISLDKEKAYTTMVLAGSCKNGFERDHGSYNHAVSANNVSLCGRKPGRLSVGWVEPYEGVGVVTCPKCLKQIEKLEEL